MTDERLRERPRERFAGPDHVYDLGEVFSGLGDESFQRHGHMQKTVYKDGRLTSAVFAFAKGGRLASHRVEGQAIVHVLEGRLRVTVDGDRHELSEGQLWVISPGVTHEVEALEEARVLMHVVLGE